MHAKYIPKLQQKSSSKKSCFFYFVFCDFIILNINKLIHKMTMLKKEEGGGGLTRRGTMYA